jgi:RNA polymerase sigma-70 factor (ECF subfamily)
MSADRTSSPREGDSMVRVDPAALARLREAIAAAFLPRPQLALAGAGVVGPVLFRSPSTAGAAVVGSAVPLPSPLGPRDADDDATDLLPPPRHGEAPEEPAAPEGEQAEVMAIVARAQGGEAEAFGELYDRYVDLVYRYVYYRVGAQALAEDLTSETFLRALRRISSYTWQGRDIGAWFVTIARNLIADHFKSGRYRLEVTTADMLGAGADRAEDGPEGMVLESITNAHLLDAVKQLNPEQQECIVLRFLQGLSVAETALAMGKNEGAIKALQYRAVRSLGRLLPEDLV